MAGRFDDDDLEDYANDDYDDEEYDENKLTAEEEQKISILLPVLKEDLKDYTGFTEFDLKSTLWYNYFELEPALKELKKNCTKKEVPKPTPAPKPEGQGLSKIAALAKARATKNSDKDNSNVSKAVSILDKLKSNKTPQDTASKPVSKLSNLAALRNKKKLNESVRKEDQPVIQTNQEQSPKKEETPKPKQPIILLSKIEFDKSPFQQTSSTRFSSVFLHSDKQQPPSYKRKLIDNHLTSIYHPYSNERLVKKIKENFSKPSPDDLVLNQQAQAFEENKRAKEEEIAQKVANLKISTPKQITKPKFKIDLEAELAKRKTKPTTSFVVIGHVDAGKSTLTGRLLLDSNTVDKNTYTKLKREAEKAGNGSFSLAWVMDQTEEERSRGVTIDICVSQFETPNANFTIVDAPGHKDFVPNMITGVAQADIAVLVVDSSTDAFESGFNLDGQTKEHTLLARSLGISKVIVAVNKMDNNDWSQDRFEEIQSQLLQFLKLTGYNESQIQFVPCSGLSGINVSSKPTSAEDAKKLSWYKGDSLLEALERSDKFERDFQKPFVMSISDIDYSSSEFTGRVDTGTIQPGETVVFAPSGVAGVIDSLCVNGLKANVAISGDNTTLKIKNIELEEIQLGDIVSIVSTEIPSVSTFESRLILFDLKRPILLGTQFVLFRGNIQQPAKITKIISLLDKVTGQVLKKKSKHLSSHQTAIVEIELINRPLPLQLFKDNKQLGRVVLRKDGQTIGAGIVENY